jgi:hypothetical protein
MQGLRNWVNYGIRNYSHHPERQRDYFSLKSATAAPCCSASATAPC